MNLQSIIDSQRSWAVEKGLSYNTRFRAETLERLFKSIKSHQADLTEALHLDLGKSANEAYMSEIGLTLSALKDMHRHLYKWSRRRQVSTPMTCFPAISYVYREPYGVVLIMVPWNYPVLLALEPLIGAIAAGNTVLLKFSPYATNTARAISAIVNEVFPQQHATVIDDNVNDFLTHRYDYIFFTGSPTTGKIVMQAAAQYLTPLTLELGGKSPVIVDHSANISLAARRIVFGKLMNCGQTCVAPDYILVDHRSKESLVKALITEIQRQYGDDVLNNPNYGHIVNCTHFDRIVSLINYDKVVYGGKTNAETLKIEPTIMTDVAATDAVMQQEIFGPVLPIIPYTHLSEAISFIRQREKPLALYIFSEKNENKRKVINNLSFGGGCINDTIMHLTTHILPFGGVGNSGMGAYHGKYSYRTFSHSKSVMNSNTNIDIPLRYQPITRIKSIITRWFLR